jgi:hypothetical protein
MSRFFSCMLLLLLSLPLAGQSAGRVDSIHFLPPEYFVGDTVEMRIVVTGVPGARITPPAALPESDWLLFRNARVEESGDTYILRIFFSSFAPGTRTLPEITFGDLVLKGTKIHTTSILDGDEGELADLRGQLYLPGTLPLLILTVILVFTAPLALIAASGLIRRRMKSVLLFLTRRRPYWRLRRDLKELGAQALMMSDRDFYYRLSDAVRSYISRRTGGDCISTTIYEIRSMMQTIFPSGDTAMRLIHFLEYADTIKFAGIEAGETKKGDDLLRLADLAASMESQYRSREKEEVAGVDL